MGLQWHPTGRNCPQSTIPKRLTGTDTGNTGYDRYTVSWDYQYEIDLADYGFSYSCMTELPDHRIGILYEKYDSWSRNELHLKDIMKYDIFTISELTAPSNAG